MRTVHVLEWNNLRSLKPHAEEPLGVELERGAGPRKRYHPGISGVENASPRHAGDVALQRQAPVGITL